MKRGPGAGGWGPGIGTRAFLLLGLLALAGCGYSDFTLPRLAGGDANMTFAFDELPAPVLTRGEGFEAGDVLNPSVISSRTMLYSAYDGRTWRTLQAESEDGIHWRKLGVVLAPDPHTWEGSYIAANGSALLAYGDLFWYWYVAGPKERPRIGLARSTHVHTWTKEPKPVLEPGPYASWDEEGVADPYLIHIDSYFYLYYLGQDRAHRQRLGMARSTDGVHWQKLRANPILELGGASAFDENGLGEPAVWTSHGFYWMLYTGRDTAENRRLGLARSTDGVHWQKLSTVFAGTAAWDAKVICDPTVEVSGAEIRVWFGGGDVASPDENLHGQIGYGVLRPVSRPVNGTLAK
ncbi:MAG: hypothetical protein LAP87_07470 [Acidobacteriia bacterium]|nr:hypothetical protein [Terriglobia bacterium]